jgi:hypothetical protein
MYEFPASPAVGDVANGYRYNGVGWAGGPIVPTPTEQIFDPVGKVNLDIPVPTWAKGVIINGSAYVTGGVAIVMRVSFDGTTFAAGASDYNYSGPMHATGSAGYQTQVTAASPVLLLTGNSDSITVPQIFTAEMNLTRPATTNLFHMKSYARQYDSSATYQYRTVWYNGAVQVAPAGSNLAIKALRIMHGSGGTAFPAGSYIHVKWLGGEVPQANGIVPEAAMDGRAYERKNGLWTPAGLVYISSTTFAGKVRVDHPLPDGFKSFQIRYRNVQATSTSTNYLWIFGSMDGTTFNMTDSAYNWRMIYTASTGATAAQWVSAGGSAMGIVMMPLQLQSNALYNNSGIIDIMQGLPADITNVAVNTQSYGTNGIFLQVGAGYLGIAGPWKAFRIQTGVGAGESYVRGDLDLYGYQ